MRERSNLIAENPEATNELLTPQIAKRVLENRAAVLREYSLANCLLVAQNPYAQSILDMCYERDLKKFPIPIGSLRDATGMYCMQLPVSP